MRYAYADIAFHPIDAAQGRFEVENRFYFTSLDGYDIVYTVEADGKAVRSGTVRLQTAPQQRETVDAAVGKLKPGRNYYLRLRAVTRTDRPGLPAGTVVAEEQFPLQTGALPAYEKEGERLALSTQGDRIEAANDRVRFAVNRTTGAALSYEIDGTELFADGFGVRPNFWRAPVDNDYGDGMPRRTQVWKEASRDADAEVTGRMEGDAAVIAATRALAGGNRVTTTYTVYPSGAVNVRMHFAPGATACGSACPNAWTPSPISAGGPKRITGTARQAPSSAVTKPRRGGSASPTCGRRRRDTTATPNGSISANC